MMNRDLLANNVIIGVFAWFNVRLLLLSSFVLMAGCASCIVLRTSIDPVLLSLMLQYLLTLQTYSMFAMFFVGEVERQMVSV